MIMYGSGYSHCKLMSAYILVKYILKTKSLIKATLFKKHKYS